MQSVDHAQVLERLESLVTPFGPIAVTRKHPSDARKAPGGLVSISAVVGSGVPGRPVRDGTAKTLKTAGGRSIDDPDLARLIAIAEGAERYSAADFLGEPRVLARPDELPGAFLDMSTVPRCSDREYSVLKCPLRPFDPAIPIRWVQGINLISGELTWLPAVMACYGLNNALPSERFWFRISTGFAVHTDPLEAILGGICEVIERDLNALVWLQRLELPLIPDHLHTKPSERMLEWAADHFIDTYLFDGTTDIAVPVAYCLQIAEHDPKARQIVGASTGRDLASAAEKALLEAATARPVLSQTEVHDDYSEFSDVGDGARYMARPEMAYAFDFMLRDAAHRPAVERPPLPDTAADALRAVLNTFRSKDMPVFAVDRTSREVASAGLTAVNIIVPGLQPMSMLPLAQYKGHSRLYEAPGLMGHPAHQEEDLNPWPQPFH